jgi:chromate reductase
VLRDKPVAVMGASTGLFGAVWAQAELRKVLHHTGARVVDEELPVGLAAQAFTAEGELADAELRQRLVELVEALTREVRVPVAG